MSSIHVHYTSNMTVCTYIHAELLCIVLCLKVRVCLHLQVCACERVCAITMVCVRRACASIMSYTCIHTFICDSGAFSFTVICSSPCRAFSSRVHFFCINSVLLTTKTTTEVIMYRGMS